MCVCVCAVERVVVICHKETLRCKRLVCGASDIQTYCLCTIIDNRFRPVIEVHVCVIVKGLLVLVVG